MDGPAISQTTKNAWQAIEFNQNRRDVNGTFAISANGNPVISTSGGPGGAGAGAGASTLQAPGSQQSNGGAGAQQQAIFLG